MKRLSLCFGFTLVLIAGLVSAISAQDDCEACKSTVKIGLQGSVCSTQDVSISIAGTTASASGTCSVDQWMSSNKVYPELKPDETYLITVGPNAGLCSVHLNFTNIPDDYKLEIDDKETTTIDRSDFPQDDNSSSTWSIVLRRKCPCGDKGAGEASLQLGSVNWQLGLGSLSDGRSAESLSLREETLSANSYTPANLIYSPPRLTTEVDVVRNVIDGSLRQVKAPQTLADIVVISSVEYDIRFYRAADVGTKLNGVYSISGQPFVTWKLKNPAPSSSTRLQISKTQNGVTDTSEYIWDVASGSWSLSTGGGARVESRTVTYPTATSRTETTLVKNSSGQVISKIARTYNVFNWGEELVQEVMDPDGAALKTAYAYYEKATEANRYSLVKTVTKPDGSWEKYDYDSSGNTTLVLRPWKDLALAAANEANSVATYYTYSNSDGIETSLNGKLISSVTEKVAGVTVAKTTHTRSAANINGEPAVTELKSVYYAAAGTQTTATTAYHSSASAFLASRLASKIFADGKKDTYIYERGNYVPNADPSLSAFTPAANGLAERETVIHGTAAAPSGVAFKSTQEISVRDQFGHVVLQETNVDNGVGYERIGWSVMDYDDRGHFIMSRNHKGEIATAIWSGEQKTSEIDSAGVQTTYTYDSLDRVSTRTKKGIVAGTFPAQTDTVTTFSYDAAGNQTTETVTGGGLSLSTSRVYDKGARVTRETDQSGLSTTFGYANGGRTQTTTHPSGATEITDKYLDGRTKGVSGTAVVAKYFDYAVNADGTQYTQQFVGSAGLSSPRWTKTTTDWTGRTVTSETPSFTGANAVQSSIYNALGQLQKETTMVGATKLVADKLYEYDEMGNQVRAGSDIDADGALTLASIDRVSDTDSIYEKVGSDWFRVTSNRTYLTNNNNTPTIQTQRERLNNFTLNGTEQTVSEITVADVAGNSTKTITTNDRAAKKQIITTDTPDSNVNAISIRVNGLLQSSSPTTPRPATTYLFDSLGRQTSATDPQTGTSTRSYSATTGQLTSTNDGAGVTSYEYYPSTHANAGRLKAQGNAAGKKIYFNYSSRGEVVQTWGEATYPLEYVYDTYGQKTELHTFRGGQNWVANTWPTATTGPADVTKWIYQASTGLLTQKQDATLKGAIYTYDELGRIKTRLWARSITCTYGYDPNTGELLTVVYSDSTPEVTFAYDRGGRQTNVTDAAGSHARIFNLASELQTEQITGGILDGIGVNVGYDSFLRRNSLQTVQGVTTLTEQTYGYDSNSRLAAVTSGSQTVTYAYYQASGLLNTTTFTGGTNIARSYDTTGRLQAVTNTPAAAAAQSYIYTYNSLNQRTRVTREDGSYWSSIYNDRGELVSGKKYWSDNSIVWGAQTEYNFDNIGNRNYAKKGGNHLGSLRQSNYTTNSLNQHAQRSAPGALDITGTANVAATVTVNNEAAVRRSDYFYKELAVDNNTAPAYPLINVVGARNNFGAGGEDAVTEKGGRVFLARTPELFTYDDDGNLTSDGRWIYAWDGENRLVSMEAIVGVPIEAKQRLEFAYDYLARRIQKKVYSWNVGASSYQLQSTTNFVYEGWNLVAEIVGGSTLLRSYVRDGGELLLVNGGGDSHQVGFDGNQNVVMLVKSSTGTVSASYDYDPFGETVKAVGEFASQNLLRFSGQYEDNETGLVYYWYRYYNPSVGRWISRDPIQEQGGANLYAMVGNDPVNFIDQLGLQRRRSKAPGGGKLDPCCCVESVDVVLSGPFEGGLSLEDYYPDLKGTDYLSSQPKQAGPFSNSSVVGAKVQITSKVKGPGTRCNFSQDVWVDIETIGGKSSGREKKNYDDITKSHRDQTKPPFRQNIGGNPSMSDPPQMPNVSSTYSTRWFTTCLNSGGKNVSGECKNKQCCVKWKVQIVVDSKGTVNTPVVTKESQWCY
jgi:RHS repeat-associated protein